LKISKRDESLEAMEMKEPEFNEVEQEVISQNPTPHRVQLFLNSLPYNHEVNGETLRSFRMVVRKRTAHCLEAALAAAAILEQHGYPALLLDIGSQDDLDHVVFVYRLKGFWGTVGRSRDPGLHGRRPVFRTLRKLVDSYADPFVDFSGRIISFAVFDLASLGGYDWRLSERNRWLVQRALVLNPHRPFATSEARYRRWLKRYKAYKSRFPQRRPTYYDRKTWTPGYPKG
jgi:hypothetical protein